MIRSRFRSTGDPSGRAIIGNTTLSCLQDCNNSCSTRLGWSTVVVHRSTPVTTFAADDLEWRRWNNVHRAERDGVSFAGVTEPQRVAAYGLLQSALSAKGLEKTRNVMRLNETIAEMTNKFTEYGEGLYHFTVMGSPRRPSFGWQFEGHQLVINYFVLRDQVVVFDYRIQSAVILIQFDHQTPVALPDPREPGRRHIHSIVRTPNGNDYGKDLLRLHYLQHKHHAWRGHDDAVARVDVDVAAL